MFSFLKNIFSSASQKNAPTSIQPLAIESDSLAFKSAADTAIRSGNTMQALELYKKAIALEPGMAKAHVMCGHIYCGIKQYKLAETYLKKAIELAPEIADSYYLLGTIEASENNTEDAIHLFEKSLELDPNQPFAYRDLCLALFSVRKLQNAEEVARKGIALFPDFPDLYMHLGNTVAYLQRPEEALLCFDKSSSLAGESPELCYNQAAVHLSMNHFDEALRLLERAQTLKPDYISARFDEAIIRLLRGEFDIGWKKFECRWQLDRLGLGKIKTFSQKWGGLESLSGKTIMLASEQGYGDAIQFIRYVKLVSDAGAKGIIIVILTPLVELLQQLKSIPGVTHVINEWDVVPPHDYYCPLMSLPLAFGTTVKNIPADIPYLKSDAALVDNWDKKLGARQRPKRIGITWSGNPKHTNDHNRSLTLKQLKTIFESNAEFVVLQKDINEESNHFINDLENAIFHRPEIKSFSDTAALIDLVDLVISVDTSILHLAAAMGKPTWVMLPFCPDWRWMIDTDRSPWYPTVKLFRQKAQGDWNSVVTPITEELELFIVSDSVQ